jgi:hypothetical protein
MTRVSLPQGLIAIVLACMGPGYVLGTQVESPSERTSIVFLLPEGFSGWACVDFGAAGAPPLPREGDALIVRLREGETAKTADKPSTFLLHSNAWFEVGGQRRPLPDEYVRSGAVFGDVGQGNQRYCAFYGTVDEGDAAPDAPGFEYLPDDRETVPETERQALVALYKATEGDHWNHRVGWLGPRGTECKWHGVHCWSRLGKPGVTDLSVGENNLVGTVPDAVAQLTDLESLNIFGNHLSGMLPQELIQRWRAGTLEIAAEASLLTDVSKVEFEFDPSELLCGLQRITLDADGHAALFTKRCRNATPGDRETFCEVKEGRVDPWSFAKLAWLLEKNGFYGLNAEYFSGVTGGAFETTRVIRGGKRYQVENYAEGGPFELWVIQRAIEGVASSIDWEKTTTRLACPEWDELNAGQAEKP